MDLSKYPFKNLFSIRKSVQNSFISLFEYQLKNPLGISFGNPIGNQFGNLPKILTKPKILPPSSPKQIKIPKNPPTQELWCYPKICHPPFFLSPKKNVHPKRILRPPKKSLGPHKILSPKILILKHLGLQKFCPTKKNLDASKIVIPQKFRPKNIWTQKNYLPPNDLDPPKTLIPKRC